ncbi:MAG: hypothetical protein RL266_2052 [Bacteroidota bacterium]|jgi:hypothetical protein
MLLLVLAKPITAQEAKDAFALGIEGIKQIDEGNYEQGIMLLKKARNLEPQDFDYSFEIGKAYLQSGSAKKAEKYLFPLQYHSNVQPELFIALANCYREMEEGKKSPNSERKKELETLRYGVQKLPGSGMLYMHLGTIKLEMEQPIEALAVFETGIRNAPNFAENYFWAAKLLNAAGNQLWAWIYAETFFNMSENDEMRRTAALLISTASQTVFSKTWNPEPEKMDQELRFMISEKCASDENGFNRVIHQRNCLLEHWGTTDFPIAALLERMKTIRSNGHLESYLATIFLESDKARFLSWLAANGQSFENFRKWRYWNPLVLKNPLKRISD